MDEIKEIMPCTCIAGYKDRDLIDPQCAYCNYGEDIEMLIANLRAENSRLKSEGGEVLANGWLLEDKGPHHRGIWKHGNRMDVYRDRDSAEWVANTPFPGYEVETELIHVTIIKREVKK